jgi:hypothetical protein
MSSYDYHNEGKRWCRLLLGFVFFRLVPPSSAMSGGTVSSAGCMVPELFATGGNHP